MRARVWGCRGSLATPGPATVRYGGNTSCIEVRSAAGGLIVLDAGTGIRDLGVSLAAEPVSELDILLTHLHLDHIEGLGFFAPLFEPDCAVRIWGPHPGPMPLADQIAAYLSPPYFPVPFERFGSRIEFHEVWADDWWLGGSRIVSEPVAHPGRTVAYRLEEAGHTLAYVPDNEPALRPDSGLATAQGADVLVHDAQYTAAEYASRGGWGHTSLPALAEMLAAAAPSRALMFHHDPSHSDDELDAMLAEVRTLAPEAVVELAREGMEISLT